MSASSTNSTEDLDTIDYSPESQDAQFMIQSHIATNSSFQCINGNSIIRQGKFRALYGIKLWNAGLQTAGKQFWQVGIGVTDVLIGYWNRKPVNPYQYQVDQLWKALKETQCDGNTIEAEWNPSYWKPEQLPLPQNILNFLQLYHGTNNLSAELELLINNNHLLEGETGLQYASRLTQILRKQGQHICNQLRQSQQPGVNWIKCFS
jgi:hypothetical protein